MFLICFLNGALCPSRIPIVAFFRDGTVWQWGIPSGQPLKMYCSEAGTPLRATFADGGARFVAALQKTIKVWDTDTGEEVTVLRGHASPVTWCCVQGHMVGSCSGDGVLKVWRLPP